jgi:hypothetical protein
VFENRMLRRIFGPKRNEVTARWKQLRKRLHDLFSLPSIRMIEPRRMKWAGHVPRIREKRNAYEGTIKFANSPPCVSRSSSGQKLKYGLMTLAYQSFAAVLLLI